MARSRNIKPNFFKNELLVELHAYERLLFIGLWCLADREGRVEDRPKRVKMELFPCDTYDVDHGLNELQRCEFVKRYEFNGVRVIQIINFLKHQTPHGTEKDSELPDENGSLTVHERTENGYVTGKKRVNNVKKEQVNEPVTVNTPLEPECLTVNDLGENTLNPESCFLNPVSPIPDSLNRERALPRRTSRRTQIDKDFYPNDAGLQECNRLGLNLGEEIGKFMNYHLANGSVMADWQAAWRTWISKASEFQKKKSTGETDYQRSKRELYERATGQSRMAYQAPTEFVEVLGALQ